LFIFEPQGHALGAKGSRGVDGGLWVLFVGVRVSFRFFEDFILRRLFGYMLTWTTYGTWVQGDRRGFVKDG